MLEGTLQDFPLPDILQLIGTQKKTGSLLITSADNVATMSFRDGRVVYAKLENNPERLGDILYRLGKITGDQLAKALQHAKEAGGLRIGKSLTDLKFVTQADLSEAIKTQIEDSAYHIFSWKTGRFKFDPRLVLEEAEASVDISVDSIIMESVRRLDEHDREAEEVTGSEMAFAIVAGGSEKAARMDLSIDDYSVLANLDGQRTVREISDKLHMSELELTRILVHLMEAGIVVEMKGAPGETPTPSPVAPSTVDSIPDLVTAGEPDLGPDLVAPAEGTGDLIQPDEPRRGSVPSKEGAKKISFL